MHSLIELPTPAAGRHLHGSLTIEIIGVEPLKSRYPLILWDIIVLILELTSFSINFTALKDDDDDNSDPAKSSDAYAYSGHLLVRKIGILDSLRENWSSEVMTDASSDNGDSVEGNVLGTLNDPSSD